MDLLITLIPSIKLVLHLLSLPVKLWYNFLLLLAMRLQLAYWLVCLGLGLIQMLSLFLKQLLVDVHITILYQISFLSVELLHEGFHRCICKLPYIDVFSKISLVLFIAFCKARLQELDILITVDTILRRLICLVPFFLVLLAYNGYLSLKIRVLFLKSAYLFFFQFELGL